MMSMFALSLNLAANISKNCNRIIIIAEKVKGFAFDLFGRIIYEIKKTKKEII